MHPMQVRYQTAPRPTEDRMIAEMVLAAQNLDELFELEPHLMDELLALVQVDLSVVAGEPVPRTADREALFIQKAADLPDDEHILALVVAAIAAPLHGLELGKLLLPVAQHMRLDAAKIAHLANGEVTFSRYRREFAIVAWFQHMPRRALSVSDQDGMSRRDGH